MKVPVRWTDLCDPDRAELLAAVPFAVDPDVIEELASPAVGTPRPWIETHGRYAVGLLVQARPQPEADRIVYDEIGLVATPDVIVTVRKSSRDGVVADLGEIERALPEGVPSGALVHRLVEDVADGYLDAVDAILGEIDELEDNLERWEARRTRARVASLRHDLLHLRRTISATRGAVRRILDGSTELHGAELFPAALEREFRSTYETLVRIGEEADVARDLIGSVQELHQAKIAENQAEVVKKLTVVASLVLVPALVTGFFGQNFIGHFNDPLWSIWVSLGLIVATTVVQLAAYRWRRWI